MHLIKPYHKCIAILRFIPALTVSREEVDGVLRILGSVFAERSVGVSA